MSALRQLLASLWTAVWLRGRLLAIGVRRRFGGGSGPAAGSDYYLTAAETPVEGIDYDPNELPATLVAGLDATRAGLLDHARGASTSTQTPGRGTRRRRTASLATAAVLAFAVVGAGATALVTGSTGVPAIDRLLGYNAADRDRTGGGGPSSRPPGETVTPRQGTPNMVLRAPFEVGGVAHEAVASSYRSANGALCLVTTTAESDPEPRGSGSCLSLPALKRQLADRNVVNASLNVGQTLVLGGYTSAEVEGLEIDGPGGKLTVRLSGRWRPDGPGTEELRSFLAVAPQGLDGGSLDADAADKVIDPSGYRVRARLSDGTVVDVPTSP